MEMKHGLRIALGALLAGLMLAAQPARAADGPYYITATEVNLRESPNGEIILVFDLNDKVFVVERDGNWSYVSAPVHEQRGWCWTDYLGDERVPVPETGSADEGAVELLKPIEPTELAVEPAPPVPPPNLWGMSGRQQMMQMQTLMQMKVFNKLR